MEILLAAEAGQSSGIWGMVLPFVLMFAVFYFLLIRPQQKKSKQRNAMLNELKKGDKVTTIGGLHGTIAEITDDTIVIRANDTVKLTFEKSAINNVTHQAPSAE